MKKIKLMLVAFMAILGVNAFAQSYSDATFTYTVAGGKATITGLNETQKGTITTVNIPEKVPVASDEIPVTAIGASAFAGQSQITTVSIAKTVETIEASAFKNCTSLSSLTIAESSELSKIGDFAFGGTPALVEISFANCAKMKDFGPADGYKAPFLPAAATANNYLKKITLNAATTNIGTALAYLPNLEEVNISETAITTVAASFLQDNVKITSLTLPAKVETITANALKDSKVTTLTINANTGDDKPVINALGGEKLASFSIVGTFKGQIVAGAIALADDAVVSLGTFAPATKAKVEVGAITGNPASVSITAVTKEFAGLFATTSETGDVTIGDATAAIPLAALGMPTTLTFAKLTGDGILTGNLTANTTLTTLTFNGAISPATAGNAVVTGSFKSSSKLKNIALNALAANGSFAAATFGDNTAHASSGVTEDDDNHSLFVDYSVEGITAGTSEKPFNVAAFIDAAATVDHDWVKMSTVSTVKTAYGTTLLDVEFGVPAVAPDTKTITVAKNSGDWYYGKFICPAANNYMISKDDAIVYQAFTDDKDGKIYMDQLMIKDGYYVVEQGQAVVIKNKTGNEVTATATANGSTMRYPVSSATTTNALKPLTVATPAYTILDANPGKDVWAMAKPENYNLTWKKFKATITLPANTIYIVTKHFDDAVRLSVVWLDGSEEETTAIKAVKSANAENGAIFNLAGQKVNASYKGVVIKDGKKYIQK